MGKSTGAFGLTCPTSHFRTWISDGFEADFAPAGDPVGEGVVRVLLLVAVHAERYQLAPGLSGESAVVDVVNLTRTAFAVTLAALAEVALQDELA